MNIRRSVGLVAAWGVLAGFGSCPSLTGPASDGGGAAKFDGTYDYSVTILGQVETSPRGFVVTNGVISSNPAAFSGSVLDDFGNVQWTGPCPVGNTGGAVFTGVLNAGNPKFGQGKWVCNNGGATSSWRAFNGQ